MEVNRVLYSDDCLNVLNDELALPTGSVDLIYLDPPFNSKSIYNLPFAGKDKDARPGGSLRRHLDLGSQGRFPVAGLERWSSVSHSGRCSQPRPAGGRPKSGGQSLSAYLINMAARLLAMRRVLSPTGSVYLHCDDTASHYLKLVMDTIFGQQNFRTESNLETNQRPQRHQAGQKTAWAHP